MAAPMPGPRRASTGAREPFMYARTGMPIDGRYLAPMLQYHFADRIAEVRTIFPPRTICCPSSPACG